LTDSKTTDLFQLVKASGKSKQKSEPESTVEASEPVPAEPKTIAPPVEESVEAKPKKRRKRGRKGNVVPTEPETAVDDTTEWDPSSFQVPEKEGKARFHDFDLAPGLMRAIQEMGFEYCTPIQAASLPDALAGKDIFGKAQTGTGKTAAFLISLFQRLVNNPIEGKRKKGAPRALAIAPTRELVMQIEEDAQALGKYLNLRIMSVYGGMDYTKQEQQLKTSPIDFIAATPGRLLDFYSKRVLDLRDVHTLIIDEADRMLDMGFIPDVGRIIRSTAPKSERHTMLYSATLSTDVKRLASQWTRDPVQIEMESDNVSVDTIDQVTYIVTDREKFTVLVNLIEQRNLERVLVFCNRRDQTRRLTDKLRSYDIGASQISGDVAQIKRVKVLEGFKAGTIRVLVATDVAARGIHVDSISHVVNFDLPENPEDYVHRIGRTGRAGEEGTSISFASDSDAFYLEPIQEFIGRKLPCSFPEDEGLLDALRPAPFPERAKPRPRKSRDGRDGRDGRSGRPQQSGGRGRRR
jgi:ATP-dependent RNA helicase RhlB